MGPIVLSFLEQLRFYKEFLAREMRETARNHYLIFTNCYEKLRKYTDLKSKKTILDVGCGRQYPQTLLFHSAGHKVVAIDMVYISTNNPPLKYWRSLRRNGLVVAMGDFIADILLKIGLFIKLWKICAALL